MTSRSLFVLSAFVAIALVVGLVSRPAAADTSPDKVFAGKIITSDKKFPTKAKSGAAMVSAIRKQSKAVFMEDKLKKTWRIYFAAFFKKGLGDIEVEVKLYDTAQPGSAPFASFEQYVDERGGKALFSDFTLERKLVGVNRDVMMVLEVGGVAIAKGKFRILGEAEKLSGKVDFSNDDPDDDEQ